MKKLFLCALALFCFGIAAQAQSATNEKAEIYGTYTFQHNRSNGDGLNTNGFSAGTNIWLNNSKSLGINGEYTFSTGDRDFRFTNGTTPATANLRARYNTFVAGPIYRFNPNGRVRPFVRALFGATRVSSKFNSGTLLPTFNDSATSFTFIGGGGVDVNLTQSGRVAFRAASVDYQFIKDSRLFDNQNGVRVSTGLVFRF